MAFKKGQSGNPKGKPKGALSKPRISDYLSEDQVKVLIAKALELAGNGDQTMLKFVLEQHFGKAVQPVGGLDGKELPTPIFNVFPNNSDSQNSRTE